MGSKRKRATKQAAPDTLPPPKRTRQNAPAGTKPPTKAVLDKSPFTEHPTVDERKREMVLYEALGSEDPAERAEAAQAVVSALLGGDGVPEPVLRRHLEKRLFRGLASSRNASRLGCGEVLIEVLGQLFGKKALASSKYTGLGFEQVLGILVDKTQAGGGATGQEERDHYIGRLFGIECFVRAGILVADKARWLAVLDLLLQVSAKKSWLRSPCGSLIVLAVSLMNKKLAEATLEKLAEEGYAKTPEGVGIWITALDRFADMKVPAQPWRHPLAVASLSSLAATLKDSGREAQDQEDGGKKPKQGGWTAQLHFVWDPILAHFVSASSKPEDDVAEEFKQFWNRVVDEGFFSKSASDSQKFSGFMIFQKALQSTAATSTLVPNLFSKNLMVCLMNQAAKEDRYLHRAATKALKAIEAVVESKPPLLPVVIKGLVGKHGAYNFDQRTNTKTVDKLLQFTTPATVKPVLKLLQLKDPAKSGLDTTKYFQALGAYLFRLSSAAPKPSEIDSPSESVNGPAINALTQLAYSNESVPSSIRESLRSRATSAFAKLVRRPEDFGNLCNAILSIEADVDADDETARAALDEAYKMLKDLLDPAKETDQTRAPRQALALLYAVGLLQFYNQEPDVVDLLQELGECYEKLESRSRGSDEGMPEYLVEILLAMVARPSSLMRQVSQQVFEAFTSFISEEALQLLTDPLAAEESAKGQQALFATEDEDLMDAEAADADESDAEELDSDVEMVNLEDAGSEAAGDSDGESNDESSADADTEAKNQEALDALDNALAEVLGSHRLDQDNEADSSSESDMTDSEMMAVDAKLAEIFKQRAKASSKKKERRDAKDTVVNFKHRVLDLLAIFVKQEAAHSPYPNRLVFDALPPLLQLVRTTKTKPLANKACDIIHALPKSLKKSRGSNSSNSGAVTSEPAADGDEQDALLALLARLHDEAGADPAHAFVNAVSTASLAVASVLWAGGVEARARVAAVYARTQLRWIQGEVRIQPAFFLDWVNWCQSHVSALEVAATSAAAVEEEE